MQHSTENEEGIAVTYALICFLLRGSCFPFNKEFQRNSWYKECIHFFGGLCLEGAFWVEKVCNQILLQFVTLAFLQY